MKKLFPIILLAILSLLAPMSSFGAEPYDLAKRLVAAQKFLPGPKEPQTDPEALAQAIAKASKGDRILAAALLATAWVETGLYDRIRRNECRPLECDRRRAWGLFQIHKDGYTADIWGSPDLDVQCVAAARKMRNAFYIAKAAGAPFPAGMFRQYGGRRVDSNVPREELRVKTFRLVLSAL